MLYKANPLIFAQLGPGQPLLPRALELSLGFFERRRVVVHVHLKRLAAQGNSHPLGPKDVGGPGPKQPGPFPM